MGIHQPHDKLVKSALSNKTVSKQFFDRLLPDKIRRLVDLDHLHLENNTFIDEEMKAAACDMLFTTKFAGRPGYLYCFIEHQHRPDPIMPIRLLEYVLKILRMHRKQHPNEPLPVVYPFVLYSGDKAYNEPMHLIELFAESDRDLAREVLYSPFNLIDVSKSKEADFEHHDMLDLLITSFKGRRNPEDYLPKLAQLLSKALQKGEIDYGAVIITYVGDGWGVSSYEEFITQLQQYLPENKRHDMLSFSEHFTNKGLDRGRVEGEQIGLNKARHDIARNMLSKDINIDIIVETTDLSYDEVVELRRKMFR